MNRRLFSKSHTVYSKTAFFRNYIQNNLFISQKKNFFEKSFKHDLEFVYLDKVNSKVRIANLKFKILKGLHKSPSVLPSRNTK